MHVTYISFDILSNLSLDVTQLPTDQALLCCGKTYGNKAKSGILISFRNDAIFVRFVILFYFLCGDCKAHWACKEFVQSAWVGTANY